jgi:hypothetical protein
VVAAVDAATAPNPSSQPNSASAAPAPTVETRAAAAGAQLGQKTAQTRTQIRQKQEGLKQGKKRFGEAVWGPFTKAGKVLWLEFTGVFFGLFALSAATGAWKLRSALHAGATSSSDHDVRLHFFLLVGVAVVFGYFCISGFVRATRRSRR